MIEQTMTKTFQQFNEEGYDRMRDRALEKGTWRPNPKKKDATTMPPSKEMQKTRKVNTGPSAFDRVKKKITDKYGKGAIMDVSKKK
jgi:hypothetical protein